MTNFYKILIKIGLPLLSAFLFLPNIVNAGVYMQTNYAAGVTANTGTYQILGTGLTGEFANITVYYYMNGGQTAPQILLCEMDTIADIGNCGHNVTNAGSKYWEWNAAHTANASHQETLGLDTAGMIGQEGTWTGSYTCGAYPTNPCAPFNLNPGKLYVIKFDNSRPYGASSSTAWLTSSEDLVTDSTVKDAYFQVNAPDPDPSVEFYAPGDEYTDVDFENWLMHPTNWEEDKTYKVQIYYYTDTPPEFPVYHAWVDSALIRQSGEPVNFSFEKTHRLYLPQYGPTTTVWYAYAKVYEVIINGNLTTEELKSETAPITLNITGGQISTFANTVAPPRLDIHNTDENSTSSAFYVDCSSYEGQSLFSSSTVPGLVCGSKKILWATIGWLFIPPDWALQDMSDITKDIKNTFPFNIPFTTLDMINDASVIASDSSADYTVSQVEIPQIGLDLTLFKANQLAETIENPLCDSTCAEGIKDLVFNFERAIIWGGAMIGAVVLIF